MKQNIHRLIVPVVSVIILVIAIVLTIILLTTPVYLGTYTYDDNESKSKQNITFYGNTYTRHSETYAGGETEEELWNYSRVYYGFYSYAPAGSSSNIAENTIITTDEFHDILDSSAVTNQYIRNSVFSITNANSQTTYTCHSAIWLQVFYCLLILASITTFIVSIKKQYRKKDGE